MNSHPLQTFYFRLKRKFIRFLYRNSPEIFMQGARLHMLCNMYSIIDLRTPPERRIISYMTEGTEFTGIADRLRSIVTAYVIARENNRKYYIYHDKDFKLYDYLEPAGEDWRIDEKEICRGLNNVAFLWCLKTWPKLNPLRKEYHCYWASSLIDLKVLPPGIQEKYTFSSAFWSLFKMSPRLELMVENAMDAANLTENNYVAVHLRFLNFFEAVEEHSTDLNGTASADEQKAMLAAVNLTLRNIYSEYGMRIVLFADSNRFLEATHPDFCTILPGKVGHVLRHTHNESITDKAFVDLMVISKAKAVISITGEGIYGGGFSMTAATIGHKPFIKVPLEKES